MQKQDQSQEYYDTPRKIKECLVSTTIEGDTTVRKPCGCILRIRQQAIVQNTSLESQERICVCQRLIGSCLGFQTTPKPVETKLRQSQEIEDPSSLYAKVDISKKCQKNGAVNNCNNYANIEPVEVLKQPEACPNYENMEFAQSLELYENAKQIMEKATNVSCSKCGHASEQDYLCMEPKSGNEENKPPVSSNNVAGYLPMSPAVKQKMTAKALSSSNPNLVTSHSRQNSQSLVPQSTVLYQRKQLLESVDNLDLLASTEEEEEEERPRSGSIDSSRTEETSQEENTVTSPCICDRHRQQQQLLVRRSSSVPCKTGNRDSSSSNDSGVFELSRRIVQPQTHRHNLHNQSPNTLPRRSKSSDPLRDISFNFDQKCPEAPAKSSNGKSVSAEAEVPIIGVGPLASGSTSSGTSDMSDYFETLSLSSSHSSNDMPLPPPSCTLRPRSGNEYLSLQRLTVIAPVPEERHN